MTPFVGVSVGAHDNAERPIGGTVPDMIRSTIFAFVAAAAALSASACSKASQGEGAAATDGAHAVTVTDKGFSPTSLTLQRGEKGDIVFTRTSDETCATEVIFPELNVKESLPLKKPVTIKVPTENSRTFSFTCGMGMYKSQVVVR